MINSSTLVTSGFYSRARLSPTTVLGARSLFESLGTARPRIWLVTARVGAGHVQAARAIEESIAARGVSHAVRYIDLMESVPSWFRTCYAGGYARLATRIPRIYGLAYRWTDQAPGHFSRLFKKLGVNADEWAIRSLRDQLICESPDLVLHTHFLAPEVMANWIRQAGLRTRQAVVVTDVHPHRIWMAPDVDRFFIAAPETLERLVANGVEADRVKVCGIPILGKHCRKVDRSEAYDRFNWPKDRAVIVVIAGSDFVVGPIERVVKELLEAFPGLTIQVATGRNEGLHDRLRRSHADANNFRLIGYTDRMPEMLAGATVVLSKSGGITTSECLAHGVALLAMFPVPGQESLNAEYVARHGAGVKIDRAEEVIPVLRSILDDPTKLKSLQDNALKLSRPGGAECVADYAVECLAHTRSFSCRA